MSSLGPPPEWLAHANRLGIVAALLSTTVHEVNNALQVISGTAEMLGPATTGDFVMKRGEAIGSQARRASALLAELSSFARDDTPEGHRADVGQIGQRALAMRQYALARLNVLGGFEGCGALLIAAARPRSVQQIVLNLLLNAERALTNRPESRIMVYVKAAGDRVQLTVDDNGPGMPADAAACAFAPRIRSSPASALGIGLATSRWLAERDGGSLQLTDSSLGGCAVTLSLPAAS